MTIQEMFAKRKRAIAAAHEVNDKAVAEKRDMTGEEQAAFDAAMADADTLKAKIDRAIALEKADATLAEGEGRLVDGVVPAGAEPRPNEPVTLDFGERHGNAGSNRELVIAPGSPEWERCQPAYARQFAAYLRGGDKAIAGLSQQEGAGLQQTIDTQGGYLSPGEQFFAKLIKAVDNLVFVRQRATVIQITSSDSLGVPSLDTDLDDASWTSEVGTISEDTAMRVGKRQLTPHLLTKLIKISTKLIRTASLDPVSLVRERLAYKFAITLEQAYLTGDGTQQPLGVFTASDDGITTTQDVSDGNAATAMTVDGLKNCKYDLKAGYRNDPSCAWMFHREGRLQISKLKDGDARYLLQDAIRAGDPDTLLGLPVMESEYAPHVFTASLYVGILGCWRYYWIVDSLALAVQVVDQLYAATNQIGYFGRAESDGMPVLADAFRRVKLGA